MNGHQENEILNWVFSFLFNSFQEREREKQEVAQRELEELQGPRSVVAVVAHGRRGSISPIMETGTVYIFWAVSFLASVACCVELVETGFWAVWADRQAP